MEAKKTVMGRRPQLALALVFQMVLAIVLAALLVQYPGLLAFWIFALLLLIGIAYTAYTLHTDKRLAWAKISKRARRSLVPINALALDFAAVPPSNSKKLTARTCIICGQTAGSAEHVFPAALGGRRKNKSIYCDKHNNAYSGLVSHLARQFEALNAHLGVRPDRHDEPKSATGIDQTTGLPISYSINGVTLNAPCLMSEVENEDGTKTRQMRFPNRAAAEKYVAERQAAGETVTLGPEFPGQLLLGEVQFETNFGGPEGLRAIAYILQTYFAQHFGDLARTGALDALKEYTLGGEGDAFVWWDFDLPYDYPPNKFEFGHRIAVGVDPATGTIFGRMSLFSTLHFAAELGFVEVVADRPSEAILVDIDPLAEHPPSDIFEQKLNAQTLVPLKPKDLTGRLSESIYSGEGHVSLHLLIGKMQEHLARRAAFDIVERLNQSAAHVGSLDRVLEKLREELSQRVFNLLRFAIKGLAVRPEMKPLKHVLNKLVEFDPMSINGLSPQASAALVIAQAALIAKIKEEFQAGSFTQERAYELIAAGPGAHVVGEAVLRPFIEQLSNMRFDSK